MLWLADECIATPLVDAPRNAGHEVVYIAEAAAGLSDAEVIALATKETRLLSPKTRISAISSFVAVIPFLESY